MDRLPDSLLLEILNRLNDPTDLARCRLVSKTLNNLSHDVRSLNIICSYDRYLKSRAPETQSKITPFKSIVKQLLLNSRNLETVFIGIDKSLEDEDEGEDEEQDDGYDYDDLYLMAEYFMSDWLPHVSPRLKSISIRSFYIQCWQASNILSLISSTCPNLVELKLKNAWLSVEGLRPMLMLTSLKLKVIELDDADLSLVNKSFPSLRVLELIRVFGLKQPSIHFLHLQTFTIVHTSLDSLTINTPNLMKLNVGSLGFEQMSLVLKAPLLSTLWFSVKKASGILLEAEKLPNLKNLWIASSDLCNLIKLFSVGNTVEDLMVDSNNWDGELKPIVMVNANCDELMSSFPNVSSVLFRFGVRNELMMYFLAQGSEARNRWKRLNKLVVCFEAQLVMHEMETARAFISHILNQCPTLSHMGYDHKGISSDVASNLVSGCMGDCPWIEVREGLWTKQIY